MSTPASLHDKSPSTNESDDDRKSRERVERALAGAAVRSSGSVQLHSTGQLLDYEVSSGYLPVLCDSLDGKSGQPQAAVFAIAYLARPGGSTNDAAAGPTSGQTLPAGAPAGPGRRPVCFALNGGPGSASLWLHLGALGPKRVAMPEDGHMPRPPYAVVDNPLTWLEHVDLVFIDPPHTGWSSSASAEARKQMLSVDGDVDALVEVMRVWLARHRRFDSEVYLLGESYGTTRAAAMADKLLDLGIALSGLVLVSCAMDLQSLDFGPANDLPYATFLPGFAAVAQYHGLLQGELGRSGAAARAAAEDFANGDYLRLLHAGARLGKDERRRGEQRLAELTGLPRALVAEKNLRIRDSTFFFEALRERGQIVGRLDARVTGPMAASRSRDWEFDPGMDALSAPYTMAALAYFNQIGLDTEPRYAAMSMSVNEAWNWNRGKAQGNAYTCTSPDLARALRRHPHLRVMVASGRYDLGTPYSASDWSLAQLDAPAEVLARISHRYYDAGHMMYTREADLRQFKADLAGWLAEG
jgi:carboxypeptidase C (cathepsin A)